MNVMDELRKEIETTYEYKCGYVKGRADAIDELQKFVDSKLDMRFALDVLTKQVIDEFIAEQMKGQNNDD